MKNTFTKGAFALCAALAAASASADRTVWLDELPVSAITQGWGKPAANRSVEGNALRIGGRAYARGVGSHAPAVSAYDVGGKAVSFEADVGVDAEVLPAGADKVGVRFRVYADDALAAESPVLNGRNPGPHRLKADLAGAKTVVLEIDELGDTNYDHADWAEARFVLADGGEVRPGKPVQAEQLGILTPAPSAAPRINGAKVFGVRPGHPILWRLPVTGERPMRLAASGLPAGASFDAATGILSGAVAEPGTYAVRFTASNAKGRAESSFKLVVGEKIALTPPLGWNSWNVFGPRVTAKDIRDTVDVFAETGLADHGWSFVNIDDFWQNKPSERNDRTLQGPERHADGTIATNRRFPDMKGLADYAHARGFKIGLYSSPGPYTCGGCTGSWGHEWQDAKTYAGWGYDYLKYDWCSYGGKAVGAGHARNSLPYRLMGEALRAQNRDIVFSLCQYGMGDVSTWGANVGGNCWRTTGDINDSWGSVTAILDAQADLWPYAGPGAWNDPDMMVVGVLGGPWGRSEPTRLTPNEQYTHVSFWSILCSPLLIGCDLTKLDDFTRSLLTNDEVIETNQDELGAQAARVAKGPRAEVWAKPMSDGSLVFALFNTYRRPTRVTIDFASLGLEGRWLVRDLWRQKDLGVYADHFSSDVLAHATDLVRLFPREGAKLRDGLRDVRDNSVYAHFQDVRPVDKPGYVAPTGYPCSECPRQKAQ